MQLAAHADIVGVAIERAEGLLVEHLQAHQHRLFCVSPKMSARARERYRMAPTKSDAFDAFVLADSLRHEHTHWRALATPSPLLAELRVLTRDRERIVWNQRDVEVHRWRLSCGVRAFDVSVERGSRLTRCFLSLWIGRLSGIAAPRRPHALSGGYSVDGARTHDVAAGAARCRSRCLVGCDVCRSPRRRSPGRVAASSVGAPRGAAAVGRGIALRRVLVHPATVAIALSVMYVTASWTAGGRLRPLQGARQVAALGCVVGPAVAMGVVFAVGVLPFQARYLVALGGIVIGSSMTGATLAGRHLVAGLRSRRDEVEAGSRSARPPGRPFRTSPAPPRLKP